MGNDYDGPERRQGYQELSERIDEHVAHIEDRFRKWFIAGLSAFGIIALSSAVALAGFGFLLQEVQQQRKQEVREDCEAQNSRNRETRLALSRGAGFDISQARTRAEQEEIRRRRDVTIALINAIVPVENCDEKVEDAVQSPPGG